MWHRCVIHHGGSGTTAAAVAAGVASIVVPCLAWLDQPYMGRWVEERGAGIHLPPSKRTYEGFAAALKRVAEPSFRRDAAALGEEQGHTWCTPTP